MVERSFERGCVDDVLTWYEELSRGYDELYLEEQLSKYEVIARELRLERLGRDGLKLLDVGCGTGGAAGFLGSIIMSSLYVGLDLSPSMCELARKRLDRLGLLGDVVAGDYLEPPFREGAADLVVSVTALTCSDALEEVVPSLRRLLRESGLLIYTILCSTGLQDIGKNPCNSSITLSSRELLCVDETHAPSTPDRLLSLKL
ncbi:MAG: class I SAM-dependent methyltransferase [Zestosphaera sp.]